MALYGESSDNIPVDFGSLGDGSHSHSWHHALSGTPFHEPSVGLAPSAFHSGFGDGDTGEVEAMAAVFGPNATTANGSHRGSVASNGNASGSSQTTPTRRGRRKRSNGSMASGITQADGNNNVNGQRSSGSSSPEREFSSGVLTRRKRKAMLNEELQQQSSQQSNLPRLPTSSGSFSVQMTNFLPPPVTSLPPHQHWSPPTFVSPSSLTPSTGSSLASSSASSQHSFFATRSGSPSATSASASTSATALTRSSSSSYNPSPPVSGGRRAAKLSDHDRKAICEYVAKTRGVTHEDVAGHFKLDRSTVSKILKQKEKWLAVSDEPSEPEVRPPPAKRLRIRKGRSARYPQLEQDLETWIATKLSHGQPVDDEGIKAKALRLAAKVGPTMATFKASDGWLENFRNRTNISGFKRPGGSEDPQSPASSNSSFRTSLGNLDIMQGIEEEMDDGQDRVSVSSSGPLATHNSQTRATSSQLARSLSNSSGQLSPLTTPPPGSSQFPPNMRMRHTSSQPVISIGGQGSPLLAHRFPPTPDSTIPRSSSFFDNNSGFDLSAFTSGDALSPSFSPSFVPAQIPANQLSSSFPASGEQMRSTGSAGGHAMQLNRTRSQGTQRTPMAAPADVTMNVPGAPPTAPPTLSRRATISGSSSQRPPVVSSSGVSLDEFYLALGTVKKFLEERPSFAPPKECMSIAELFGKASALRSHQKRAGINSS